MFTLSLCEVFFCLASMYQRLMSSLSFLTVILQNMTLNSRTVIICMDGAQTMAGKQKGLEALIKSLTKWAMGSNKNSLWNNSTETTSDISKLR